MVKFLNKSLALPITMAFYEDQITWMDNLAAAAGWNRSDTMRLLFECGCKYLEVTEPEALTEDETILRAAYEQVES